MSLNTTPMTETLWRQLPAMLRAQLRRRLGLPVARLEPGEPADIVVLAKPLLDASAEDVELVLVDGMPRVVSPALAGHLQENGYSGQSLTVSGVTRWIPEKARLAA